MDNPDSISDDASRLKSMLNHDAKGQLLNIVGFCREIEGIVDELKDNFQGEADESEKFNVLVSEDLVPCLNFLALSVKKLEGIHHEVADLSDQVMK